MRTLVKDSILRTAKLGFDFGHDETERNYYVLPGSLPVRVRVKHWGSPKVSADGVVIGMAGIEDGEERVLLFLREYLLADGIRKIDPAGHFLLQVVQASVEGTVPEGTGFLIAEDMNDTLSVVIPNGSPETVVLTPGVRTAASLVEEINLGDLRFVAEETEDHRVRLTSTVIQPWDTLSIVSVENSCYGTLGFSVGTVNGSGDRWDPDEKNPIVVATGPNAAMSPTVYLVCRKSIERANTLPGSAFSFDLS